MAKVIKIHHIALVAPDLNDAIPFWQEILGLSLEHIENVPSQKSKVAFLSVGDIEIEIVEPTAKDSGVAKYLEKRGPGIHHICLEVDDIEAMLTDLRHKGVRLIDEEPKVLEGRKMAFIHPKSAQGVLVELYEVIKTIE